MDALLPLSANLAENVVALRDGRSWTQAQLAKVSGVPRSTIAQLESGSANPTLSVLSNLAFALQVSLEELVSPPRVDVRHFKRAELPERQKDHGRARIRRLLPDPLPGLEIDRIDLQPGARFTGSPHKFGTREYLACESGELTLWASGERFDLAIGDTLVFRGDQPHSYQNRGRTHAVGFSVVALAAGP
jgi:XRE family transcriptional regulator, regulator of sulfur utilization